MSGIPAWAVRGAKVVCIEGSGRNHFGGWAPKTGGVYTVRSAFFAEGFGPFLRLAEYRTEHQWRGMERGWDAYRFRPVIEPKTEAEDLAHFKHHLTQKTPEVVE